MLLHGPASKTNHKLVRIHSALIWCWDKPQATLDSLDSPRPGFEESHHLPPYSILCITLQEPHPNGTFSRDSQGRVSKLFQVGLSRLWELISPGSKLRSEWGLNQSCSSPLELSYALSHSFCRRREEVDSQLLMVGSQTTSLTPDLSFTHNLGYRCPNGSCEAISTLQEISIDIKNTPMRVVLTPAIKLWVFGSPGGLQVPTFGVWVSSSHLAQSGVATMNLSSSCNF